MIACKVQIPVIVVPGHCLTSSCLLYHPSRQQGLCLPSDLSACMLSHHSEPHSKLNALPFSQLLSLPRTPLSGFWLVVGVTPPDHQAGILVPLLVPFSPLEF